MTTRACAVALCLMLVPAAAQAVNASAASAPDLVAFQSDRNGNHDVWTVRSDGTHLTQITNHPADDSDPDWSPDGTKIAFASRRSGNQDVWVIDVDTGQLWQITTHPADDFSPAWSPDGKRIAFVSCRGITGEIWVADVSNLASPGVASKLTAYDPGDMHVEGELSPDWCFNGFIAYQTERGHRYVWSIWATNPDTGQEYEVVARVGGAGAYSPAWSPDGLELAYSNLQEGSPGWHNDDIYVAQKDGTLPNLGEPVTSDSVVGGTGIADSWPAWSPSGERIYFHRWNYEGTLSDIFVVNRNGTGLANLTSRPGGVDCCPSVTACAEQELPDLEVNKNSLNLGVISDTHVDGSVYVYNAGTGSISWTVSSTEECWLAVSPTSGTCSSGAAPLTITVNPSCVEKGPHSGSFTVSREGAATDFETVMVMFDYQPPGQDFCDVPRTSGLWQYVNAIFQRGITNGCGRTEECVFYCPSDTITRAQTAVMLCRAAGKPPLDKPVPTFCDVLQYIDPPWNTKPDPYFGYIERLADPESWGGIPPTGGCKVVAGCRYFCPNDPVTREQVAKFLCLATGTEPMLSCSGTFADAGEVNPFCPFIERLGDGASWPRGVPVTSGCQMGPPRLYCPCSAVTRGQMAVFLSRAFGICP